MAKPRRGKTDPPKESTVDQWQQELSVPVATLYDTDFSEWAKGQAALLRMRADGRIENDAGLDWSNIAEEIDSLAKRDRRELGNRICRILEHLILLHVSPASEPRGRWQRTVIEQRDRLRTLLEDSPSLKPDVAKTIAAELPTARELAALSLAEHNEQPTEDLATLTFTAAEVLGA